MFLMIDSSDHISGKTGLSTAGGSPTLVVNISKNGGTFAAPSGSVTEVGNGYYKIAGNATDNNTLGPLIIHATGTGADPTDVEFMVVAFDPLSATDLGLSRLDQNVGTRLAYADISLSGGAVTVGTINNDVITNASIAGNAITQTKIATNAIGPGQIAANAITSAKFASGAITADAIAAGAITVSEIADGAITADKIANNAITAAKIAADAIDYDAFTANALVYIANQVWLQSVLFDMNTDPYPNQSFGERVLRGESAQASVSVTGSHHVAAVVHSMEPDVLTASALAADAANDIADAFLNRNINTGSSSGRLVKDALKILRNRFAVSSGTLTVYEENDTTPAWTSVVTSDAAADPIVESNPT
jgi:hypothetical protein